MFAIKHVLYSKESDSLGTKLECCLSIGRIIRICSYSQYTIFVHNVHVLNKARILSGIDSTQSCIVYETFCSVQTEYIALFIKLISYCHCTVDEVDMHCVTTYNTAFPPTTCNQCSMRCHTSACSKKTIGSAHSFNILRVGLFTYENYLLLFLCSSNCILSSEDDSSYRTARTCRKSFCYNSSL